MNKSGSAYARVRAALARQFPGEKHRNGYVDWPEDNLVSGVRLEQFEEDLRKGDGGELRMKFCAIHSSAALAVNCFACFKDRPEDLFLLGDRGGVSVEFEKQMCIVPGRRPSNLDVWIDRGSSVVAIESKFLEYFTPKKPEFAELYKTMEPLAEPCWWSVCERAWNGDSQHLDIAQLVKHYFGLKRFQNAGAHAPHLVLLYLFWEPTNWQDFNECQQHHDDLDRLADQVATSSIEFRRMTYPELWQEWMAIPELREHARNLRARYEVRI